MPKLSELVGGTLPRDPEILGLTADSRAVAPGFLFAALPGSKVDGAAFIPAAIGQGAVAVIAGPGVALADDRAVLVTDPEPRRAFALAAAAFSGRQPENMAAVTGTNGKTSVANFTRQIWTHLGLKAASMGTIGVTAPGFVTDKGLTTPDPVALHEILAQLTHHGVTHGCMEASSHGLDQHRLDGVKLRAAAFTNLTRDHLDYHGTMETYAAAKLRLFHDLLPGDGCAVINADSDAAPQFVAAAQARGQRVLTYGAAGADIRLVKAMPGAHGQVMTLELLGRRTSVALPLAGAFQAHNALCALGLAIGCGADPYQALDTLEKLEGVAGRLQKVAARKNGAPIFVDYAHTPDALQTVLTALRPHTSGKLVVVFGCGGDRDPGKRAPMGRIAAELADRVIVTDDNPRSEDAASIRRAVMEGCPEAMEIGHRVEAIQTAVRGLEKGDVLCIAGKGHERGQIIGNTVLPLDDSEEAQKAVAALGEAE